MAEPVYIRASSIGSMFDCAYRWQAIHLERMTSPTNLKAQIGTAVHAGTAVFDAERVRKEIPSLRAATDAAAEAMEHPREDVALVDGDKPSQAKDIAVSLVSKYCQEFAVGIDYAGVEIGVEGLEISDLGISLGGTADRVRILDEHGGVADLKTGKTIVTTDGRVRAKGHAFQLGVYTLLAEAALKSPLTAPAAIIGLQTNVTPEKQRIALGEVENVKETLVGDDYHKGLLPVAADIAHGRTVWGNPQSMLCHDRYCPRFNRCFFRR